MEIKKAKKKLIPTALNQRYKHYVLWYKWNSKGAEISPINVVTFVAVNVTFVLHLLLVEIKYFFVTFVVDLLHVLPIGYFTKSFVKRTKYELIHVC